MLTSFLIAVFLVSAIALILIEKFYAKTPLVPLELLKGTLGAQMLIQFLLLFAQFSVSIPK